MNMISRKDLCFSTDFELFYHFTKLGKISFQKISRLIVSSINRFFVNFSSIFMVLTRLLVLIYKFYCSILIVQAMYCTNLKLEFFVDQPQLILKVELCKSLEFFIQWGGVEWFSFFGVLKVACDFDNKTFVQNFLKFWDLLFANGPWKSKNLKKINHFRVKIWGWSKKQHGTFSGCILLVDSKKMHILCID
jgi:hypothetical protein